MRVVAAGVCYLLSLPFMLVGVSLYALGEKIEGAEPEVIYGNEMKKWNQWRAL